MYIDNIEMESYLENYDGAQHFKIKDLFSKEGREKFTEEIKDKHPKLKKALDKHPALEKAVKAGMAIEAAMLAQGAALALAGGAYFAGSSIATTGSLAVFKPAMQATLKSKGKSTNGLTLQEIVKSFMSANGKKSKSADSDFNFIADYFGKKMSKGKREGASDEDIFVNNLIDGAINVAKEKGTDFINDLITGNDAAKDTPLAPPVSKDAEDTTTDNSKKNMYLILGAIVLIVIFARK